MQAQVLIFTDYAAHAALPHAGIVKLPIPEGAVDTLCFDASVERVLSPHLWRSDVVVLNNLGAHKASCLEQVAEGHEARARWLPPYSPDGSVAKIASRL